MKIRNSINQFMKHTYAPYVAGVGMVGLMVLFAYIASKHEGNSCRDLAITSASFGVAGLALLAVRIFIDVKRHQITQTLVVKQREVGADNSLDDCNVEEEDPLEDYAIANENEVVSQFTDLNYKGAVLQEYIDRAQKQGIRLVVAPKKYQGSWKRVNKNGPVTYLFELPKNERENMTYRDLLNSGRNIYAFLKKRI